MGDVACIGEMRNVHDIFVMKFEGKRSHINLLPDELSVLCVTYVIVSLQKFTGH
jgi:hypothetical protein